MTKTVRNTATALLQKDFPEGDFVLQGVIGEGLTLFGGKPKLGKSIFVLNVALSVASGGYYLGRKVRKGVCAYLSLENKDKTTKRRLSEMIGRFDGTANTDDLLIENKWDSSNPLERLDNYLTDNPDVTFVVIDTLIKFFSRLGSSYNDTYSQIDALRELAESQDVPILVIDHLIKSDSPHLIDMFSNSNGKTGAADNLMGLLHSKQYDAELHVMGRDVDDLILPLEKQPEYKFWELKHKKSETKLQKDQLLETIKTMKGRQFSPQAISKTSGVDVGYCRKMLNSWASKSRYVASVAHGQYSAL